jgi:hypothetical protein
MFPIAKIQPFFVPAQNLLSQKVSRRRRRRHKPTWYEGGVACFLRRKPLETIPEQTLIRWGTPIS